MSDELRSESHGNPRAKAPNVLLLMSDQHVPFACGTYGNRLIRTPNIDGIASRGTTFDASYCNSPICVPSRASMATGRYVHQTGNADNATPYTGAEAASWGHRALQVGIPATTIGKLHYRAVEDNTGFTDQISPLHVRNGVGDLYHALRDRQPPAPQLRGAVTDTRAGESDYIRFDRQVAGEAADWVRAAAHREEPWLCKVSFVTPHYPFVVPEEYLDLYPLDSLPTPLRSAPDQWDRDPAVDIYRRSCALDEPLTAEQTQRAVQHYYGLVSFMDAQVGTVLDALEDSGQAEDTIVLYVSDHGELLGTDGLWFKGTMGEASVRIPTIIAGPGVPSGHRCQTNVSLVDVFPTIVDALELPVLPEDKDLPGDSLLRLANAPDDPTRTVFSEFHSANSHTGSFMVRQGSWKYVLNVDLSERLFNLDDDPHEYRDLANDPAHTDRLEQLRREMHAICDPVTVDREVRATQRSRVEEFGGVDAVLERPLMAYSPTGGS